MDSLVLPLVAWDYLHTTAAEVEQKDIFERPGLPLLEDWNMAFADLEKLQKHEANMQPLVHLPAFDLDMVETKTDKVCELSALDSIQHFPEPGIFCPGITELSSPLIV